VSGATAPHEPVVRTGCVRFHPCRPGAYRTGACGLKIAVGMLITEHPPCRRPARFDRDNHLSQAAIQRPKRCADLPGVLRAIPIPDYHRPHCRRMGNGIPGSWHA
jgi:hypothetical protein